MVKFSFAAVANSHTRLLILGSLPGERSLAQAQYYAHPQNQFWRLMEAVIDASLAGSPYAVRLAALRAAGVGLWDVVRSARRVGSLDAAIRDHQPNALAEFATTLPLLRAVAFNGAKASAIGRRELAAGFAPTLVTLPSSSPARAIPFERKLAEWVRLKGFLETAG